MLDGTGQKRRDRGLGIDVMVDGVDRGPLQGKRVLIVEDEALIAMLFEDMLADAECVVVGPAMNLRQALELAQGAEIDLAVLDVNLNGEPSFPRRERSPGARRAARLLERLRLARPPARVAGPADPAQALHRRSPGRDAVTAGRRARLSDAQNAVTTPHRRIAHAPRPAVDVNAPGRWLCSTKEMTSRAFQGLGMKRALRGNR